MSNRPDHLIERAAARLREANAAQVPDGASSATLAERPWPEGQSFAAPSSIPSTEAPGIPTFQPFVIPVQTQSPVEARQPSVGPTDSPPDGDDAPSAGPIPIPATLTRPALAPIAPALTLGAAGSRPATGPAPSFSAAFSGLGGTAFNRPGTTQAKQPLPVVQLDALERAGMVVARTTRTRISEEYRIAIGRILRTLHENAEDSDVRNVLMITSARPGEGKSFTALNIAGSIAQNGTDAVLLVDVDPKMKPLSDQLGLGESQGFLDLVSDPALRPEDLLRSTAIPNLAVLPIGTRLGGAAQTTGGAASMRPIIPTITRLARRFPKHLIMLDAPPCLSTSDPHALAPHVGQVVLVVEAQRTQRTEVEAAIELIRVCPNITLLLNKVRMTTSHTFGAYDYFGSYT